MWNTSVIFIYIITYIYILYNIICLLNVILLEFSTVFSKLYTHLYYPIHLHLIYYIDQSRIFAQKKVSQQNQFHFNILEVTNFFEFILQEINHACAGGLWAELVSNRGYFFKKMIHLVYSFKRFNSVIF